MKSEGYKKLAFNMQIGERKALLKTKAAGWQHDFLKKSFLRL
jgi:hypothetical protein